MARNIPIDENTSFNTENGEFVNTNNSNAQTSTSQSRPITQPSNAYVPPSRTPPTLKWKKYILYAAFALIGFCAFSYYVSTNYDGPTPSPPTPTINEPLPPNPNPNPPPSPSAHPAPKRKLGTTASGNGVNKRPPFPGKDKIESDLIGKSMPHWNFDNLSEFHDFIIVDQKPEDNNISQSIVLVLQDRDEKLYHSDVEVKYALINDNWQFLSVSQNSYYAIKSTVGTNDRNWSNSNGKSSGQFDNSGAGNNYQPPTNYPVNSPSQGYIAPSNNQWNNNNNQGYNNPVYQQPSSNYGNNNQGYNNSTYQETRSNTGNNGNRGNSNSTYNQPRTNSGSGNIPNNTQIRPRGDNIQSKPNSTNSTTTKVTPVPNQQKQPVSVTKKADSPH